MGAEVLMWVEVERPVKEWRKSYGVTRQDALENVELETGERTTGLMKCIPMEDRIEELEAKLAEAVDALGGMVSLFSVDNVLRKGTHLNMELDHARTTLAELKGQEDE